MSDELMLFGSLPMVVFLVVSSVGNGTSAIEVTVLQPCV
jgi:hypothetical protein